MTLLGGILGVILNIIFLKIAFSIVIGRHHDASVDLCILHHFSLRFLLDDFCGFQDILTAVTECSVQYVYITGHVVIYLKLGEVRLS